MLRQSGFRVLTRSLRAPNVQICASRSTAYTPQTQEKLGSKEAFGRLIKGTNGKWYSVEEWKSFSAGEKRKKSPKSFYAPGAGFFFGSAVVVFIAGNLYTFAKVSEDLEANNGNIPQWISDYEFIDHDQVHKVATTNQDLSVSARAFDLTKAFLLLNGALALVGGGALTVLRKILL
jgi:hypothetical protein